MESPGHILYSEESVSVKIRNLIGEAGKPILEYIAESDEDREQLFAMMKDGEIPDEPSQRDPSRLADKEAE